MSSKTLNNKALSKSCETMRYCTYHYIPKYNSTMPKLQKENGKSITMAREFTGPTIETDVTCRTDISCRIL